jgi:hypothetical protein
MSTDLLDLAITTTRGSALWSRVSNVGAELDRLLAQLITLLGGHVPPQLGDDL